MRVEKFPGAWVLEVFRRGGVDLDELKLRLPDETNELLYHMDSISAEKTERLLSVCAELNGDLDFGLTMNEHIDITMYGLYGYLLLYSSTVQELFNTLERYYPIYHTGGPFFKVTTQKETVSIEYGFSSPPQVNPWHLSNWALGFIAYYLRAPLGEVARPLNAHFICDSPDIPEKMHFVFGHNIEFNQPNNKLIYHKSILNRQITDVDPRLIQILRNRAEHLLKEYLEKDTLLVKIRMLLIERIDGDKANASDIAGSLNYTLSTFKRKLSEENINFKQIKESVKNELAQELLSKTKTGIYEIAKRTGFSDQSSFTRFFIRCNKNRPLEYRMLNK